MQLASQWRLFLLAFVVGGGSLIITHYVGTALSNGEFIMRCRINQYYQEDIRPILAGIIRQFVNRIVCWYDAAIYFSYGFGRRVVFPILREGGFGPTVSAFARFLAQIGQDLFIGFFFTDRWFTEPMDFTNIYVRWQEFWTLWQTLLCYGCNDLCPFFTKTPVIPMFFGSDQVKDLQFLCGFGNMFNAYLSAFQQLIFQLREIIYPTLPQRPYANFAQAFEYACASGACFIKSWENALQAFWDTFIPFDFQWENVLCVFDVISCMTLRSWNLFIDLIIHSNDVVSHFANTDSTYWDNNVKHMYIVIINMMGPATYFNPIVDPIQNTSSSTIITTYQLLTSEPSTPWGSPNPLYNTSTAGECACIALTRILCDPMNNGTTCEQRFNGTLLTGIDPCCLTTSAGILMADWWAGIFEFTLHLYSFDDFIIYLDKQPFTTQLKDDVITTINCMWQIFRAIKVYGVCIQNILSELTLFIVSTIELNYRIVVSLLTLPYFQAFLPQTCNFISCPGDSALNMTLQYLDRISDPTNPDGLINCLCYILNSGFNVPYAGCKNVTCVPTGFITPTQSSKRWIDDESFYDYATRTLGGSRTYRDQITPIMTYKHNSRPNSIEFSLGDFSKMPPEAFVHLDDTMKKMSIQNQCRASPAKRDLIYNNFTDVPLNCTDPNNPPPCFGLCCLPTKIILLASHTVAFGARAINAAFQTRFTDGSTYWNGNACPAQPCLASDLVTQVTLSIAPLQCLCEFIKLVLPPQGFSDPCCAFSTAGELISVFMQIVINVGNSVSGDSPNFYYIRGNQTFNTTGTQSSGIPLVDDFTVFLSLARTLFDCICDFIRSIFQVAFSGFNQAKAFDPCCIARVYFRAILELFRTGLRLVLALTQLDTVPAQQFLYVNGYKNARPFCPLFVGDIGIVQELKNVTSILLKPPVNQEAITGCMPTVNLDEFEPDNEGLPTCICTFINAVLAMINSIDAEHKGDLNAAPTCMLNVCCPIFSVANAYKHIIDFAIEIIATIWQNWEFKENFVLGVGFPPISFFFPQETLNYLFCDEYAGLDIGSPTFPDGVTPNPYYSASYLSVSMTQIFYAPFVQNKPNYTTGYIPNTNVNATIGVINANTPYDPNNPQLQLIKCGRVEPTLAAIQSLFQNCLCMSGNNSDPFSYTQQTTFSKCSVDNPTANGIANMLDTTLRWLLAFATQFSQIFPKQLIWPACLCCGGPLGATTKGMIIPFGNMLVVGLRQVIEMVRNIPNPTYWSMNGGTLLDGPSNNPSDSNQGFILTGLSFDLDDFRRTWINRFLAPFADAACSFYTNCGCLLAMILGDTCESQRYSLISSALRYYFEYIIHVVQLIEGFIKLFSHERPGQCVGGPNLEGNAGFGASAQASQGSVGVYQQMVPTCSPVAGQTQSVSWQGIDPDQLGRIVSAALQFVIDAFIGFSELSCSALCPRTPTAITACSCYNLSPYINWGNIPRDRCRIAWYLFYAVNGWSTLYLANGGNPNYYPPGSAGTPGTSGTTWENDPCEKNIDCVAGLTPPLCGSVTGLCGGVCQVWMTSVWCRLVTDPVNPHPGSNLTDWIACSETVMGDFDSFTGQSMQNRYGGEPIWQRRSETPCPGSDVTVNYCEAVVPPDLPFTPPGYTNTAQSYIEATIFQTSSLRQQIPNLSNVNGTAYDATLCDSPDYGYYYGTSVAEPYGFYTIAQFPYITTPPPGGPSYGNTQLRSTGPYYGACNWFETQCSQQILWEKIKYLYGYANNIFMNTGFSGANPWELCCWTTLGGTNWTSVVNMTEYPGFPPGEESTDAIFAFFGVDVGVCADPRISEFNWLNAVTACNPANMRASIVGVIQTWMRNCRYAGVNAYDVDFIAFDFAYGAANEAAFTCQGAPSFCATGGLAGDTNFNFPDAWANLQATAGFSFTDQLQLYPLLQQIGQCSACRVEASGCDVIGLKSLLYQPICDRKACLANGWCKNDLMVPCCALTNPAILDGVIIAAARYFKCLSIDLFGAGGGVDDLFGIVITVLKFFWQISGALVRLVVTIVMVVLDVFVVFFQDLQIGGLGGLIVNAILGPLKIAIISFQHASTVFYAFINIFQQPLVTKRDIPAFQHSLLAGMSYIYSFHDGHECVLNDPTFCLCQSLPISDVCRVVDTQIVPSTVTMQEVLSRARKQFGGITNCDMLYEHLVSMQITNWTTDVPAAERFQAMECLSKRSQGESFHRLLSFIPVDFFYNPHAMFKTVFGLLSEYGENLVRNIRDDHAKITKDAFTQQFGADREHFYKSINLRGYRVQDYYRHVLKMDKSSVVWDSMLKLDMYYYKYQTGYYHLLWNKIDFFDHFRHGRRERREAVVREFHNVKKTIGTIITTLDENYGERIRDYLPKPEMPQLFRMINDGSLWDGIKRNMESAPAFEGIVVNINPWEFEHVNFWPNIEWTPEIIRNWEAGQRILYGLAHTLWPHYTTKEVHDRFISNGNCKLYDGAVELGTTLIDYCLNDFVENTPTSKNWLGDYLSKTSHLRKYSFFRQYQGRIKWQGKEYRRPRVDTNIQQRKKHTFHRKVYKRATTSTVNPGGWGGLFLDLISDIFGIDLLQTLDNWSMDFTAWAENPNTDPADYPNVGAKYWFSFLIRCEFPQNVNCSIGSGLSTALWQVGLVYLGIFLVLAFTFPQILTLVSVIFSVVIYAIIVAIVAWHYSPACIALFPSTEMYPGVTVPIAPIPMTILPMIPMCIWDDIIEVLDSMFAACYTWIPLWILNTSNCLPCDQKLGFVDCLDVGIVNPLDVVTFWGYKIIGPSFCDFMINIASALNFLPGDLLGKTITTCTALRTATSTQLARQYLCGGLSVGTLAWVAAIIYAIGLLIITIVLAVLNFIHALILIIPYLWIFNLITGPDKPEGFFVIDGKAQEENDDDDEEQPVFEYQEKPDNSMPSLLERGIRNYLMPRVHVKKE